jgi:hypothetical protein
VVSAIHLKVPFVEVEYDNRSEVVEPPHVMGGSFRRTSKFEEAATDKGHGKSACKAFS